MWNNKKLKNSNYFHIKKNIYNYLQNFQNDKVKLIVKQFLNQNYLHQEWN